MKEYKKIISLPALVMLMITPVYSSVDVSKYEAVFNPIIDAHLHLGANGKDIDAAAPFYKHRPNFLKSIGDLLDKDSSDDDKVKVKATKDAIKAEVKTALEEQVKVKGQKIESTLLWEILFTTDLDEAIKIHKGPPSVGGSSLSFRNPWLSIPISVFIGGAIVGASWLIFGGSSEEVVAEEEAAAAEEEEEAFA